jgi:hypothetical protein
MGYNQAPPQRLKLDFANLLVTPDLTRGVGLWFATNNKAHAAGREVKQEFDDRFDPDAVFQWLNYTRLLLRLTAARPGDTAAVVSSGELRGLEGGTVVVGRVRNGSRLSDNSRVLMVPRSGKPMLIELPAPDMEKLLDMVERGADGSAYVRDSTSIDAESSLQIVDAAPLEARARLHYPAVLQDSLVEGEVWARYCIRADGRPDLSTFRTVLSDDAAFERSVRRFLEDVRYKPATRAGIPIPQMVSERFLFTFRP